MKNAIQYRILIYALLLLTSFWSTWPLLGNDQDEPIEKRINASIDRFISHLDLLEDLDEITRDLIYQNIEDSRQSLNTKREVMHDALKLIYPDYAMLEKHILTGKLDLALALSQQLERSNDLYLSFHAKFQTSKLSIWDNRHEDALSRLEEMLIKSNIDKTLYSDEALFLLAVVNNALLMRKQSVKLLDTFLDEPRDVSERVATAAIVLKRDLQMIEDGALSDIHERMSYVRRRLSIENPGKAVQKEQTNIISLLDKLIEAAQQRENSGQGSEGNGEQMPSGSQQGESGAQSANNPADKSTLPEGSSEVGKLGRKKRGSSLESWGDLPPREQAKLIANLKGQIPGRYKDLIEQYHRSFQDGLNDAAQNKNASGE